MARYSPSVQNLISKLGSLPGIGGKSAQRLAFSILSMSQEEADALTGAIVEARRLTKRCSICQNFTDSDPCPICSDPKRDTSTVCVVESPRDVSAFERMHEYNGLYHVLHGVYNPVGNMNMNDITLTELFARLTDHPEIKEVIVATNQTAEGNATALYISRLLGATGIKVTRLASGLPMGSDIEFADDLTLASALKGRKAVGS
ncbi:MAG: recombination protein RecR [Clostridiales bacterium]|jgi:recombination protein RecR|nr:recombination protein RecR [Clostridiales bacterium]